MNKWAWLSAILIASGTVVNTASTGIADEPVARVASPTVRTLQVDFTHKRGGRNEIGQALVEAADGGMLFQTTDGHLWLLEPTDIKSKQETTDAFRPRSSEEVWTEIKSELPPGFLVYKTAHYVLIYNTSETYVRWVGDLLERLHHAFYNFWSSRGIKLDDSRFPLVALVFDSKAAYLAYAERELGQSAQAMIGYYHMETNRVAMFDLTGVEGLTSPGQKVSPSILLNQLFSQPQAERTISTIVHEAVHQIAFNSGLQVRLADNPLWVSEGLAMFFETPDVKSPKGWSKIGQANFHQHRMFLQYLPRRPTDSLTTLIADSSRFHAGESVGDAYAESWALTYYLLKSQTKAFAGYLKELGKLEPLGESTPRERLELFQKHFGSDMQALDTKLVKYMRNLRS